MEYVSVGEAARRLSDENHVIKPRHISDLFYNRTLREDLCPLLSNRRVIPESYLPFIRMALQRAGKLARREACAHA